MGYIGAGPTRFNTADSLNINGDGATVTGIKDEDNMASNSAVKLATQQSIKAYVDSQIGANNELSEVLANGNTTGGNDISFADNDKAIFGASSDLQIYHDGTDSVIKDTGTGNLVLTSNGGGIFFRNNEETETYANFNNNGSVQLRYDNGAKLETTATGIDVTGTVTADGLTVSGATEFQDNPVISNGSPELTFETANASHSNWQIAAQESLSQAFEISSGQRDADASNDTWTKRFTVLDNGDISFYDSTGVTQGLYWDASTQRLGLGTTAPASNLHVKGNNAEIRLEDSAVANATWRLLGSTGGTTKLFRIYDSTNSADRLVIDGSGNVGIGTNSPSARLHLKTPAGDNCDLFIEDSTFSPNIRMYSGGTNINSSIFYGAGAGSSNLIFRQITAGAGITGANTERMRIDNSGNLLVGKTTTVSNTAGHSIYSSGAVEHTRDSNTVLYVNRTTTEGKIVDFRFGGSSVGSIGVVGGESYIGTDDTGFRFDKDTESIKPFNTATLANRDAAISLGGSAERFANLYLSGTVLTLNNGNNANGNIRLGSTANNSTKYMSIRGEQYASGTETEGYGIIGGVATSSDNRIRIGGGLGEENASTQIEFITAGNTTTRGGTERMRIDASGNLLVGNTSYNDANTGILNSANGKLYATASSTAPFTLNRLTSTGEIARFKYANTAVGSISVTGSGTTYNTTSDIRLKTDIAPIADATDKLMAMNAVSHKWKAEPDADAVVGFIAQEMAEIVPEAVSKGDGQDDMWSMDYGRITPVLVAALQDAHKKIEQLEQRIADMEAK